MLPEFQWLICTQFKHMTKGPRPPLIRTVNPSAKTDADRWGLRAWLGRLFGQGRQPQVLVMSPASFTKAKRLSLAFSFRITKPTWRCWRIGLSTSTDYFAAGDVMIGQHLKRLADLLSLQWSVCDTGLSSFFHVFSGVTFWISTASFLAPKWGLNNLVILRLITRSLIWANY